MLAADFVSLEVLGGTRVIVLPLLLISPLYSEESCWEIRLGVKALHSASIASRAMRALNSALRCRRFRLLILVLFRGGRPRKPALFINKSLAPFRGATSLLQKNM